VRIVSPRRAGTCCLAGLLLLVSSVLAIPPNKRTADQSYSEAEEALKRKDFVSAVALLKEAYSLKPNPNFTYNIGYVYRKMGHYGQAADYFKRVESNSKNPRELRLKAAGSFKEMEAKLGQAWLRIEGDVRRGDVYVDGQLWRPKPVDRELELSPGDHIFELQHPDFVQVFLEFRRLAVNRRTVLNVNLSQLRTAGGQISLIGSRENISAIVINDTYQLQSNLSDVQAICLPAGSYQVRVTLRGQEPEERPLMLGAGVRVTMEELLGSSSSKGVRRLSNTDSTINVATQSGASVGPWPYVTAASGLAVAGVGTWLLMDANSRRDDAEDKLSSLNTGGTVEGITRADAIAARDDANTRALWGTISTVAGASIVVGGVVWWFLERFSDSPSESAVSISVGPSSMLIEGRF